MSVLGNLGKAVALTGYSAISLVTPYSIRKPIGNKLESLVNDPEGEGWLHADHMRHAVILNPITKIVGGSAATTMLDEPLIWGYLVVDALYSIGHGFVRGPTSTIATDIIVEPIAYGIRKLTGSSHEAPYKPLKDYVGQLSSDENYGRHLNLSKRDVLRFAGMDDQEIAEEALRSLPLGKNE